MLVKALCDYYDILSESGKLCREGYSKRNADYMVLLSPEGKITNITNYKHMVNEVQKDGKIKEKMVAYEVTFPKRTEKPGIDANIIEQRALYLFGLNYDAETGELSPNDETNKARKSFAACKEKNLDFLTSLQDKSDVVKVYIDFLRNWNPDNETENVFLKALGKNISSSSFIFSLSTDIQHQLQDDQGVKKAWDEYYQKISNESDEDDFYSQCCVTGERAKIARIHGKIKGVAGGLATGTVLVGFNSQSEESYGRKQSYNSNISEKAAEEYVSALNFLLGDKLHKTVLDEMTIVHFAMAPEKAYDDAYKFLMGENNSDDEMDKAETDQFMRQLIKGMEQGHIVENVDGSKVSPDVDFYIVGFKPNSSRIAVKFIYRKKFGEIVKNIYAHAKDMEIGNESRDRPAPLWRIKKEFISNKSNNENVPPAIMTKLMEAVLYGDRYPVSVLQTIVRRVKTDSDIGAESSRIRAGLIKAYINRSNRLSGEKEEIKVSLDKTNEDPAYLCGRLFAILEKIQSDASGGILNHTIKDSYFSAACSKPATIFPRLCILAQNHISRLSNEGTKIYYTRLIGEVQDMFTGKYPEILPLQEQGKFIIGYYQQNQDLYRSRADKENNEKSE